MPAPLSAARLCALLLCAALQWPAPGGAADDPLPRDVAAALRQAGVPAGSVAVLVQDLATGRTALGHNADALMNPASTMKLVTTFAALELLGPTYTWKTEFLATAPLRGDVLEGDLVIRGSGDPKLTVENLWLMLRNLRARGLREIRGDLVLDRGAFDTSDYDPSRFDNEPLRPYNVGPDALLVNFKSVRFQFVPDPVSRTVAVAYEPRLAQLEVAPQLRLTDGDCGDWRAGLKAEFRGNGQGMRALFSGTYPASCGERTWNVSLFSHQNFTAGVFRQLWQEMGGTLRGGVRDGSAPAGAQVLLAGESPSLSEVVRDINKFSNNVMARQLFLTLSAGPQQPGRNDRSFQVVQGWLAQRGLALPGLVMENGSGLSRQERISAAGMARLLAAAWHSAVMPEFIASLPLVAHDGTMRRRMKFESIAGQAHMKTGSLSDARTIAGYLLDRTGRRFTVVCFVNHANAGQTQAAQDALLRWVHEGAGTAR